MITAQPLFFVAIFLALVATLAGTDGSAVANYNTATNVKRSDTRLRNGQEKIITPCEPDSVTADQDAITIEVGIWMTMQVAWTQFLYSADIWIKIARQGNGSRDANDILIRPTNLKFETKVAVQGNF